MAGWRKGERHNSWAANANLATVAFAVVFLTYITWSLFTTAPPGLTTLLGVAGGAWFGAITDEKRKKDAAVSATAERAEVKADKLIDVAERQHPGSTGDIKTDGGEPHESV